MSTLGSLSPVTAQSTESSRSEVRRVGLALAMLVLVITAPVMHPRGGEQQASRYALTAAIWDHQTVVLDRYAHVLGRDHAVRDGVIYSDKAPGQPVLAVPFYGIYRWAGGQPAEVQNLGPDWGLWWVTLWTAAVPGAVLAYLMYRWAREYARERAVLATLAVSLGTLLVVYSTLLFGHVLAALFVFGSFLIVRDSNATPLRLVVAGLLAGLAVATEYPVALIVLVLVGVSFYRHRTRSGAFIAGGLVVAFGLALYNVAVSGDPFVLSYQWTGFSGALAEERALVDTLAGPKFERLTHVMLSQRGLLVATPVVIPAILGFALLWRKNRTDTIIAATSILMFIALQVSWWTSFAGGAGPRYITPSLPFLAAPLALAWDRWARGTAALTAMSVLTMMLAAFTNPQIPSDVDAGLAHWSLLAAHGFWAPNAWSQALGSPGWLAYALTIGVAILVLRRFLPAQELPRSDSSKSTPTGPSEVNMAADV